MSKYLFFDLDGTLLPLDSEAFLTTYVKSITRYFSRIIDPKIFSHQLMDSSYAMIANLDPKLTNEQKYMAHFFSKIEREQAEFMPLFEDYYEKHYHEVKITTRPTPLARQIVTAAAERGAKLVLATNPLFPRTAIEQRMQWAGIEGLPWELVTSYEHSHFCKPHVEYYAEILDRIGAKPEECLHIGNDVEEDLPAAKLGIQVALVEDCLIDPHNRSDTDACFRGSLADLAKWLEQGR